MYYGRAIDNTSLPALNELAMYQSAPTKKVLKKCNRLLDYVSTYLSVALRFYAFNMHLHVDSDAAYLVTPKARSRITGLYYFKLNPTHNPHLLPTHPVLVE